MSKRLRLLAVPAAVALALVPAGIALADPTDIPLGTALESATSSVPETTDDDATEPTQSSSADETSSTPTRTAAPAPANRLGDVTDGLGSLLTPGSSTSETTTSEVTTSETTTSEATTSETTTSGSAPPADPPACVAAVVQTLITDLQAALGTGGEELAAAIQAALANPANLPAFLEGLPDLLAEQGEALSTQGEALLTKAGEDLQKCLPAPPGGGGTPTPTPTPQPEPVQPAAVHYQDCEDARTKGAAPVHAGHPGYGAHLDSDADGIGCEVETVAYTHPTDDGTAKLAYTGVETEPLIAWGAALLAAGGWLILSGRRKA